MMPSSDPLSPSSQGSPAPQSGTPALPPAVQEKKPDKKLETPVLVAMISAVVTLISAILGSPLLLNLINKPATPTSISTAVLAISQNSLLPNDSTRAEFFQATITPPERGTDVIKFTSTPKAGSPTSVPSLLESTSTLAALPPTPVADSYFQCLAEDLWFPYPNSLNPEISDGCWKLAEWGFSTDQDRLLLVHNPSQDQERGISMPISGDIDIRFTVKLNEFRTRSNKVGFLNFGIVQNDPFTIYTGGYLSYQQIAPGPASPVRVLISGSHQATQKISDLEVGFQHEVVLSIQDDQMIVYLNGEQAGDPVRLPPTKRAFWIGYVLPSKGELDVTMTNFTIQTH
jgi:hypothetical protein